MTTELIVEAEWMLKDYWTKVRFPFQTEGHAWSDIDVLAYSPVTKHLVVAESKVQGSKNKVYGYTPETDHWFIDKGYLGFLDNLPRILGDGVVFDRHAEPIDRLTVQLVSNTVILPELADEARTSVVDYVRKNNPGLPGGVRVDAMLDSTLDVLARVIERERQSGQGRRYGHPVVDIARELNRYLDPSIEGAGQGKARTDPVRHEALRSFWKAIRGPNLAGFLEPQK